MKWLVFPEDFKKRKVTKPIAIVNLQKGFFADKMLSK